MRENYVTGGNGSIYFPGKTEEERCRAMSDIIFYAHNLGYQIGVHATGDRAIKAVIDSFVEAENREPKALRHYIIHGDFTPVESQITELMVKYNIGVAAQPGLAIMVGPSMSANISADIMAGFAPLRALIDAGIHVSGGSDAPIIAPDWKQGIQSAVLRETADGKILGSGQRITVKEAIRMYTIESAWQDRMENIKGSVEVGKLADFCILDEDILSIDPHKIKDIPTLITIVGGKIVHNSRPDMLTESSADGS
jgi:predicted amidohydrolase YtcJ